jgi:uncharacterized protein YbaR (Trm112 family)
MIIDICQNFRWREAVMSEKAPNPMICPRCDNPLEYVGTKKFHEGSRGWGFWLGDLGELFTHREHFDIYVCPRCGRVELFVDGIGEEFRPH